MNKPVLPENLRTVISRLNKAGHRADIVGGCVRDFLLGKSPSDYDLTTDATPDEMREIFSDMRTLDIGIKHGTLTVLLDGEPFEITTYRSDGEYIDHRRPSEVTFTRRLEDDLKRRDFTMNAICYNERDGFTDLFSGTEDINKSIVRAVGEPELRFEEDALRILRAVRFASVLDFVIEENTARAALYKKDLLASVSGERIAVEWRKLLSGIGAYRIINEYSEILKEFIPLNNIILPSESVFLNADAQMRELLLYALSSDEPHTAFLGAADRMRYDNKTRKLAYSVLSAFRSYENREMTKSDIKFLIYKEGEDAARGVIELLVALDRIDSCAMARYDEIISDNEPRRISDLDVNGLDLVDIGIKGKAVGEILEKLLVAVISSEIENESSALLKKAKALSENQLGIKGKTNGF